MENVRVKVNATIHKVLRNDMLDSEVKVSERSCGE